MIKETVFCDRCGKAQAIPNYGFVKLRGEEWSEIVGKSSPMDLCEDCVVILREVWWRKP